MVGELSRIRVKCKSCSKRMFMYPKVYVVQEGKLRKRIFRVKCPNCFAFGEFKFRRTSVKK